MNKTTLTGFRALTIGAVMTLGFAAAASAADFSSAPSAGNDVNTYVVRYADLDLAKVNGTTVLYSRISQAARIVCRPLESREINIAAKYRACLQQAVSKAVADVNSPVLSQYHELHTKGDKTGQVRLAKAD